MTEGQTYPSNDHLDRIDGGLYGQYRNTLPEDHPHMILAHQAASEIIPRDSNGNPSPTGKIGFISVGMSNTRYEFSKFIDTAHASGLMAPSVVLINGAQVSHTAEYWADPNDDCWINLASSISKANLSSEQVQVVWMKLTHSKIYSREAYPVFVRKFRDNMAIIAKELKHRYPNIKIIFLSNRIYAGYAQILLSPEPYAYEGGFSNRLLIEDQINGGGVTQTNYTNAPVLVWGPYMWADGTNPNSEGLSWQCEDFKSDGIHPSSSGTAKVADKLLEFFNTNPLAYPWFSLDSLTPTATPGPTSTPGETPAPTDPAFPTDTPTPTETPLISGTPTPTEIIPPSETPVPTETSYPTNTPTPNETAISTTTPISTETPAPTLTPSPSQTPTQILSPTATASQTPSPTHTPTATPTQTNTVTPTQLQPTPTGGSSDYSARWLFDEGSGALAADSSPNSNALTLTNGAAWTSGHSTFALSLDGTNDFATRPDASLAGSIPSSSANPAQDFTISTWVKIDRTGRNQPILTKQGFKSRGFDFFIDSSNHLSLEIFSASFTSTLATSNTALAANTWYHVAVTYGYRSSTTSQIRLYINGNLDKGIDNATGPLMSNTQPLNLGYYSFNNWYYDGVIDDARIYPRVLTALEIAVIAIE